jgi:hypothetical protein
MDLSPVTVPAPPPLPALPPVVAAVVEAILGPSRYAVTLQGVLLELELDLILSVGDRVPFRVREQTPARLVLEVLPRGPDEAPPPPGAPPIPEELREIAREVVRMGAPIERETLEAVAKAAPDPVRRQAAAFLAAHGFEPSAPLVEAVARLAAPPPPAPERAPGILQPLAAHLQSLVAETAAEVPQKAPRVAGAPPPEPMESLRRVLETSPRLRAIDRLVEAVSAARPEESVPPREVVARLGQALRLVRSAAPESVEAAIREMPKLPRPAVQELLSKLLEMERQELARIPELAAARAARGTVLETAERLAEFRFVNQLAQLRNEGVMVLEVPVRAEGRVQYLPLRVRRERGGRPEDPRGERFTVALDVELSRIGPVRALLEAAARALRVTFRVRDRAVRDRLQRGAAELVEALRAQGFEPAVASEVADRAPAETIFDVFASPGNIPSIDVKA